MPLTIQRVNIMGHRWCSFKDGVKTILAEYRDPLPGEVISREIYFDTLTGDLGDGQYAVQENGYVWAKVPRYAVFKMPPEYVDITTNKISDAGVAYFKEQSVRE